MMVNPRSAIIPIEDNPEGQMGDILIVRRIHHFADLWAVVREISPSAVGARKAVEGTVLTACCTSGGYLWSLCLPSSHTGRNGEVCNTLRPKKSRGLG